MGEGLLDVEWTCLGTSLHDEAYVECHDETAATAVGVLYRAVAC